MNIPTTFPASLREEYVCWSRMQAEAGQSLEAIVERKERERRAGDGSFFWGVGNAPAVLASVLSRASVPVRAVFSIMKSRPKAVDVAPARTVAWTRYIDAYGAVRDLPPHALVTSRADSASGAKKAHYALVCRSSEPLVLRAGVEGFDPSAYRNAGGTGAPVGNSQVTALLRRAGRSQDGSGYEVNLSAWLADDYWVRLLDPVEITPPKDELITWLSDGPQTDWINLVTSIRHHHPRTVQDDGLVLI